ncbi:hypothetical protein [Paenibacillus sp. FSL W7-1332]|uniref:hypothetical protein n=1 Tax=Paenibacillus TaxID=44249 RepID=UPI0030D240E2
MNLNVPVITIRRHNLSYSSRMLRVDDYLCGQTDVNHLLSRGYQNFVVLTYSHDQVPGFDDRLNGASKALLHSGKFNDGDYRENDRSFADTIL